MNGIATYHPHYNQLYISIDNDRILLSVSENIILSNYNHPVVAKTGTKDQERMDFDTYIKNKIYQMDGEGYTINYPPTKDGWVLNLTTNAKSNT
jgi:hypothetical protein